MDIEGIIFDPIAALISKPVCLLPMLLFVFVLSAIIWIGLFASLPSSSITFGLHTVPASGVSTLSIVIVAILALFLSPLISGIYVSLAMQLKTGNKQLSLGAAVEKAKQKYLSLLGASLIAIGIAILIFGVLYFLLLAPSMFNLNLGIAGLLIALVLILLIIVAWVLVIIRFFEIYPAVLIEDKRAFAAVKRSMEIGKQHPWSVLGTVLLLAVIIFVITIILELVIGAFSIGLALSGAVLADIVITVILITIVGGVIDAWAAMIPGTFYYSYVAKQPAAPAPPPAKTQQPPAAPTPQKK